MHYSAPLRPFSVLHTATVLPIRVIGRQVQVPRKAPIQYRFCFQASFARCNLRFIDIGIHFYDYVHYRSRL